MTSACGIERGCASVLTTATFARATPAEARNALTDGTVHLWRLPYARAAGRAPLLALLAAYLGRASADEVTLVEGPQGKPRLADPAARLEFNWSHSGEFALVALARGQALGVDVERIDRGLRAREVAERFFDPGEAAALASVAPTEADPAFIGLWCAKEAVLKAAGAGIAFGLERLAFAHGAGADWSLVRIDAALGEARAWQVTGFEAARGYRGALAWRGAPRRIACFEPAAATAARERAPELVPRHAV